MRQTRQRLATGLLALALAGLIGAAPRAQAQPDPDALQLYALRLLQTGSRLRSYPEEAYLQKLSGTAIVEIALGTHGQLLSRNLTRSTGHALLDRQAIEMIEKAVPVTEIPSGLAGTAFTIRVNVVFALP